MIYALDANVIIHLFKGVGRVAEQMGAVRPASIAIPAVALVEVERGLVNAHSPTRRRRQLDLLLSMARILPFDESAIRIAASLIAHLEKRGEKIGPFDSLIAATAPAIPSAPCGTAGAG